MKLSDAILLGAAKGKKLNGITDDDDGGSCAMGAAYIAAGVRPAYVTGTGLMNEGSCIEMYRLFPILSLPMQEPDDYNVRGARPNPETRWCMWDEITYRNNELNQSREAISHWVAGIEAEQEASQPGEQQEVQVPIAV